MFKNYLIEESASLPMAHYKLYSVPEHVLFTLDSKGMLTGYLTPKMFPRFSEKSITISVSSIYDKKFNAVAEIDAPYRNARDIIARFPSIQVVPVIDSSGRPVDVLRKWQLFFKDEYFRAVRTSEPVSLPYPQYAVAMWRAAEVGRSVGIKAISILEFGVARGDGLLACELLAKEIGDIWGIRIDVFGFDGGKGLPEAEDSRDCPQCWGKGQFPMDFDELQSRLSLSTLVIGDIFQTAPKFLAGNHALIGAMLVDVDYYSSTVPILEMLETDPERFLPIVNMYFDDVGGSLQFQGESLAIREFNSRNQMIKISPETESFGEFNFQGRRYGFSKLKACHLYMHTLYSQNGFNSKIMHDFWR